MASQLSYINFMRGIVGPVIIKSIEQAQKIYQPPVKAISPTSNLTI
jgi:hypothetical protein